MIPLPNRKQQRQQHVEMRRRGDDEDFRKRREYGKGLRTLRTRMSFCRHARGACFLLLFSLPRHHHHHHSRSRQSINQSVSSLITLSNPAP